MSQGLFTAASGIAANQSKLNVISDNIANINTVAFKSSQVNFKTVYARTLSAGSAPTTSLGGINPQEVGLGVMVAEVGRNFDNGSVQTTGRTTDLNIQGEGFFVVKKGTEGNNDAEYFLTRAGNFSADAEGYIVNPDGMRVVGNNPTSTTGSTTPVRIPTNLNFVTPDAEATTVAVGNVGQNNGSTITEGTFTMTIDGGVTTPDDVTVTITDTQSLATIAANMQTALSGSTEDADSDVTVALNGNRILITSPDDELITFAGDSGDTSNALSAMAFTRRAYNTEGTFTVNIAGGTAQTVTIEEGDSLSTVASKIQTAIRATGGDTNDNTTVTVNAQQQLVINTPESEANLIFGGDTTGLVALSGFPTAVGAGAASHTSGFQVMQSAELVDQSQVIISDTSDSGVDTANNATVTTFSIGNDGAVEATYSNGAKLTVTNGDLKYVSANGREIIGTNPGVSITDNADDVQAEQLQMQLATVVNPMGLKSQGGNLFSHTSVAGDITYGTAGSSGMGVINAGSLEASNVDLPQEFSNMILAQRGVEANSRTFGVQNEILRNIVNLGR